MKLLEYKIAKMNNEEIERFLNDVRKQFKEHLEQAEIKISNSDTHGIHKLRIFVPEFESRTLSILCCDDILKELNMG